MARIELTQSGVLFNEELHEYWLDGKQLSGITEALRKQLHPDMYSSIPKRILEQAAEYGTSVHKSIEEFQKNWINCLILQLHVLHLIILHMYDYQYNQPHL